MTRLTSLTTVDIDTTILSGGKASDTVQDFLVLLGKALVGEIAIDKATPQVLVVTDRPTIKGGPLISDIVSDA